jgi:hypothetical protein
VLLLADGAWTAVGTFVGMTDARTRLQEAAAALLDGRLDEADAGFQTARAAAEGAGGSLHHPAALVADILPGLGDDVDALQAMASSAENLAVAGVRLVDAAEASGWDGNSIPGIEPSDPEENQGSEEPAGGAGNQGAESGDETNETDGAAPAPPKSGQPSGDRARVEPGNGAGERGPVASKPGGGSGQGKPEDPAPVSEPEDPPAAREPAPAGVSGVGGIRVRLRVLKLAAPHLAGAAAALTAAEEGLRSVDSADLSGIVGEALAEARDQIGSRARLVRSIADLSGLLPGFLGGEEPRTYFLVFQNLSAPRGSGGFLGVYGLLEAQDGELEIQRMAGVRELGQIEEIEAPQDYTARYGRFGGTEAFLAANYSPDFPTTARVLLEMYRESGRGPLDGVIAVDPIWAAYTLEAVGSVHTEAWPEPLTPSNVSRILHHDVFLLERNESDASQIALGRALVEGLLTQEPDPRLLADAVSRAARERHLQVYSDHPGEESLLGRLGVSGAVRPGPQPLFVVWQDATAAKTGYFAHKAIEHSVVLTENGTAQVTSVITLDNRAPPNQPPSPLMGNGQTGDPVGYFAAYVNVYLPEDAVHIKSKIPGSFALQIVEREFGIPVVTELLAARAGETTELIVTYEVPGAVSDMEGVSGYRLDFLPQPAIRPERLVVEITLPAGTRLVASAEGLEQDGGAVRYLGTPTSPRPFWVRYRHAA